MAFMDFMKKDKKAEDSLDIPPPPPLDNSKAPDAHKEVFPPLEDTHKEVFPHMDKPSTHKDVLPPVDDMSKIPDLPSEPKFPMPEPENRPKHMLPPTEPKGADIPPVKPSMPKPIFPKQPAKAFDDLLESSHHESTIHHKTPERHVFIEVGRYRRVLKELGTIKKSLKQSDNELSGLIGDIKDEEKTFSDLHSTLGEVESKLNELESSLFSQ